MIRLSFLFLFASLHLNAQQSIRDFLRSARNDVRLQQYDQSLTYLDDKPWRLSPIQRLELRTQNRELEPTQQEYAVRVTPSNPWEVRRTSEYFRSYRNMLSMERELILQDAFKERYQAVVSVVINRELRQLAEEVYNNVSQQVTILEKQIGSDYFDADDYLDSQLDLVETSAELHEMTLDLSGATKSIQYLSGVRAPEITWSVSDLISVTKIQRVIDSLRQQSLAALLASYHKEKIRLAQVQYKLEKSNINTGFVQAEYDNRRIEQDRTPFNISLGITIPIFNPNKGDMARRKLDEFEAMGELSQETAENDFTLDLLADQVSKNAAAYLSITEQLDKLMKSQIGKTLSELKDNDPRVIVRFYGSTLKLKEVQLKLYGLILSDYIEYVSLSGVLTGATQVNFLSPALQPLD